VAGIICQTLPSLRTWYPLHSSSVPPPEVEGATPVAAPPPLEELEPLPPARRRLRRGPDPSPAPASASASISAAEEEVESGPMPRRRAARANRFASFAVVSSPLLDKRRRPVGSIGGGAGVGGGGDGFGGGGDPRCEYLVMLKKISASPRESRYLHAPPFLGAGGYCLPRHGVPRNSRYECLKCLG